VLLTYTEDGLAMRIDDDGTGPTGPTDGNGLPGMRERAAALNAHLLTAGDGR
jgi:signal transduction histidine kinase